MLDAAVMCVYRFLPLDETHNRSEKHFLGCGSKSPNPPDMSLKRFAGVLPAPVCPVFAPDLVFVKDSAMIFASDLVLVLHSAAFSPQT